MIIETCALITDDQAKTCMLKQTKYCDNAVDVVTITESLQKFKTAGQHVKQSQLNFSHCLPDRVCWSCVRTRDVIRKQQVANPTSVLPLVDSGATMNTT